jgi:hypothetical protein
MKWIQGSTNKNNVVQLNSNIECYNPEKLNKREIVCKVNNKNIDYEYNMKLLLNAPKMLEMLTIFVENFPYKTNEQFKIIYNAEKLIKSLKK